MTLLCLLFPILGTIGLCEPALHPADAALVQRIEHAAQEQPEIPAPEPERGPGDEIDEGGGDAPPPEPTEALASTQRVPEPWQSLADCESGDWLGPRDFDEGTARWRWAAPGEPVPFGTTIHHGGLQFLPSTWDWIAGDLGILDAYPHAYDAPPSVQVEAGVLLQQRQGWEAWPTCARRIGLLR